MKKCFILLSFSLLIMCSCSEKSLETVDKSTQFPYYSISNGVIVKVTNDATLSTKSSECEYYTLSAPEYPDAEPIIVLMAV